MIKPDLKQKILETLAQSDLDLEAQHGENTLKWVLKIEPNASLALQIAALGHDIERSRIDRYRSEDFEDHKEYKRLHSEKGATMLGKILEDFGIEDKIIQEVKELVRLHEVGGTKDADILRDADSISFFDNNLVFYIKYKGLEEAKKQVEYKFNRCSDRAKEYIEKITAYQNFISGISKISIKTIFFDVGGVLIKDFSKTNKWEQMLDDLELTDDQRKVFEELFDIHESRICSGEDPQIFINKFQEKSDYSFSENYDFIADFVNRFEANPELIGIINKARGDLRIGLLTNMYPRMFNLILDRGLLKGLEWDILIDSSEVGVSKPEEEIFKIAEEKSNTDSVNILFIDNTEKHIESAKELGWQTLHFDSSDYVKSNKLVKEHLYELTK